MPLSPDEAYYWTWSRALAPGYLDHPPMVALWIAAGTALAGPSALGVRLLAPLSAAAGSVLLARTGDALFPHARPGVVAAVLLNATLLFGAGAATMTPDTPLLFFWALAMWAAARARAGSPWWLALAGLSCGLALDSKYTAVFLAAGLALWVVLDGRMRPALRGSAPWVGAALAAAAFAPVLAWNAAHGWASFAKQGGRLADFDPARALRFTAELIGGQLGLATPLLFLLFVAGAAHAVARAVRGRDGAHALLACLIVPGALVFVQHALGDRVQANWPAVLYPAVAIAAAARPRVRPGDFAPLLGLTRLERRAVALGLAVTLAVYAHAATFWPALPSTTDPAMLRLAGWRALAAQVDAARRESGAAFVAADNYGVAAELAFLLPPGTPVVGLDRRWDYLDLPRPDLSGQAGLLLHSRRRADDPDAAPWDAVAPAGEVARTERGVVAEGFRLFRVTGSAAAGAAAMPAPAQP